MSASFDNFQLNLLKQFVQVCQGKPELLHSPQLKFFKDWLERYGSHVHGRIARSALEALGDKAYSLIER